MGCFDREGVSSRQENLTTPDVTLNHNDSTVIEKHNFIRRGVFCLFVILCWLFVIS